MSAQKRKGDDFERELAAHINTTIPGLDAFRAPLSGGGNCMTAGGSDILGAPDLFIEAKRVEKLNFHEALRQAERNKSLTKAPEVPIVINRKNRQPTGSSLVLLRLDDFLKFYAAYLKENGHVQTSRGLESNLSGGPTWP